MESNLILIIGGLFFLIGSLFIRAINDVQENLSESIRYLICSIMYIALGMFFVLAAAFSILIGM